MSRKLRFLFFTLLAVSLVGPLPLHGQAPGSSETILHAAEAGKILPSAVFFRGQSAPVQARNSAGIKYADGMLVLSALVDNSGYSTSVQQKYQAYLITEVPVEINGHTLPPGAYGAGFVQGKYGVLDLGNHDLFAVDAAHDAELKRPTPLQILADTRPNHYRLYEGRDYVVISRPADSK